MNDRPIHKGGGGGGGWCYTVSSVSIKWEQSKGGLGYRPHHIERRMGKESASSSTDNKQLIR